MNRIYNHLEVRRFLALFASILGGLSYAIVALGHAHGQVSVLDEGLYLYKGLLFASGVYRPFQDFGPLTNHMPLSFMIPGWIQLTLGPGIRAGRYFAIFLGVLMLVGLWLTVRRLGGTWWAAAVVWAVALNSAVVKMYSQATSQVLVSCILVWILFLVVGEPRKLGHVLGGVALASLLLLTRINLAPVLPILLLYIFWRFGRKWGSLALILAGLIVGFAHLLFWPGILKLWANWLPRALSPFLNDYRLPLDIQPYWDPAIRPAARLDSLVNSLRIHWLAVLGFLGVFGAQLFLKGRKDPRLSSGTVWMLVAMYAALSGLHAWASLGLNYCVYCLRSYMAFFLPVGLILFVLLGRVVNAFERYPARFGFIGILFILPLAAGMPLGRDLARSILATDFPRISASLIPRGTLELGVQIQNKFGFGIENQVLYASLLFYLAIVLLPLASYFISAAVSDASHSQSLGARLMAPVVALMLLEYSAASVYFSNGYHEYDCGYDVLQSLELAGQDLDAKLDMDGLIFWGVGQSPVPLLSLGRGTVYPSQLNGDYTFMLSGNPVELMRFGYWSQSLADLWMKEARYILVDEGHYDRLIAAGFQEEIYDEISRTPPTNPCAVDSSILIFERH
jgi:hypothetical protein